MNPEPESIQSLGGKARAEQLEPEQLSAIGKAAADARWNVPRATHSGVLKIGDMSFPCSVLTDGSRVLTQSDFMQGMGMYYSGWVAKNKPKDQAADLPHFLSFKSLQPFIERHLGDLQSVVLRYRTEKGAVAHGIKAGIIPKICEVWMDADEAINLGVRQKVIAQKAKILMRALAHVGIIALVDEATGYQEVRDKKALSELLDRYLLKELAAWAKRFPDEFYKEIFRLRGWQWRGMKVNRPSCVGTYTIDLVYDRLAPTLYEELKKRMPKTEGGSRKGLLQQLFTDDVGHPALQAHIAGIMALQRATADRQWDQFKRMVDRAYPKFNVTIPLALPESESPKITMDDPAFR